MTSHDLAHLLPLVRALAVEAGILVMPYFKAGTRTTEKADSSPVTEADIAAQRYIADRLAQLTPDIPVVGEEGDDCRPGHDAVGNIFWLVDPVDGTREFLAGIPEFTVNIGLVVDGTPLLGVIDAPALGSHYTGLVGTGAWADCPGTPTQPISARQRPTYGGVMVVSRFHSVAPENKDGLNDDKSMVRRTVGSSLKFCALASGTADLYPRFGPTHEWDTAAGHAILVAAGGHVTTVSGEPLRYGKPQFRNPDFIATGAVPGTDNRQP